MKERPILFSGAMVRAILEGRKTQTRRAVKGFDVRAGASTPEWNSLLSQCPYGDVGYRLWVRETWRSERRNDGARMVRFNADNSVEERPSAHEAPYDTVWRRGLTDRWRPSSHMPRWASRITLEVTGVRVERVQDISEDDARAEGIREVTKDGVVKKYCVYDLGDYSSTPWDQMPRRAVAAYAALWNDINGKGAFLSNPWVWVVEFRRL